ncbi:MAG TPA: ricin-type beta-trefoil lectin domain protein [Actinoplanes sp.]|jgi:hypothetical protein|nr:ricin-type beta-trefoil lectin domain protein [Actinoplanes sp.]
MMTRRQMLDGDELPREEGDRVLVRPYVRPADSSPGAAQEIPQSPDPDPPTAVLPRVDEQPGSAASAADARDRRVVSWLVGGGLAIVVVAIVAVIALWPRADDPASAPPPATVWPTGGAGPNASPAPSATARAGSAPATASPSRTGRPPSTRPAVPARAPSRTVPSATLAPPPAADRTGAISGPGGHCLDVRGGLVLPGSPLSVYNCNGTLSQRWTVAADGTLGVAGMCATADGTGSVYVAGCDAAASGQWRAGPGSTLVNVGTGQCLADPDNGTRTGGSMRLAACGGMGQRWTLP